MSTGPAGEGEPGGEEAAWRDLMARYAEPADPAGWHPWPDREDLPDPGSPPGGTRSGPGSSRTRVIRQSRSAPPPGTAPLSEPDLPEYETRYGPAWRVPGRADEPEQSGEPAGDGPDVGDTGDEHFVPPPPPPLPKLDSLAKGAWAALLLGPGYLIVATALGWLIPGWAALLAVAAFVGGFAVVVLRLSDRPSQDDGPDDGAVVLAAGRPTPTHADPRRPALARISPRRPAPARAGPHQPAPAQHEPTASSRSPVIMTSPTAPGRPRRSARHRRPARRA